mgnify:CR=1 FL=1
MLPTSIYKLIASDISVSVSKILTNKQIDIKMQMRLFNALIGSIFLYNSELWSITKERNDTIDICQRNLLRKILKIRWPQKISNKELYKRTRQTPWSRTIRIRRIRWLGHLLRLPTDAPARQALEIYLNHPAKHPRGARKVSWVDTISKDLAKYANLSLAECLDLASDRKVWRSVVAKMNVDDVWEQDVTELRESSSCTSTVILVRGDNSQIEHVNEYPTMHYFVNPRHT